MENISELLKNVLNFRILNSVIIIIINIIIYRAIVFIISKTENREGNSKKRKTYLKLTKSLIRYVLIIITILVILQINGVDVSSALAGVGIVSVIIGLAIQDWLKDIIRGSSILSDDYFSVGDVVKYNNQEGKVLLIGIKTTKIQDLATGNVIAIANRKIEEIEVVSNCIYVRVPMPYELNVKDSEKAIEDIIKIVKGNEDVTDCSYKGVAELSDSSVQYLLEVKCNPLRKLQVRRDTNRAILCGLEKNKISVPYNQIDVHNKN